MNTYSPGNAVRLTNTVTVAGVLTDPANMTLVVHGPDGSNTSVPVVRDGVGVYHGDFLVPATAWAGVWSYRFQSTGLPVDANALGEGQFQVVTLDF